MKFRIFTSIFFFALVISSALHFSSNAQAATFTVCASGCDATSIINGYFATTTGNGDIVEVKGSLHANPYNPASESYPLNLNGRTDVTIQCVDEGSGVATIGNAGSTDVIELRENDITIKDCNLDRVNLRAQNDNGLIDNNIFIDTSAPSNIDVISGTGNTISNNTDLNGMVIWGASIDARVTGNTIKIQYASGAQGVGLSGATGGVGGPHGAEIDNNTFTNAVGGRANYTFIDGSGSEPLGEGLSIHGNTFSFPTPPTNDGTGGVMISLWSGGVLGSVPIDNTSIYNNYFTFPTNQTAGNWYAIALMSVNGAITAEIYNNTIKMSSNCGTECSGIYSAGDNVRTIDLNYNLIYSDNPTSKYGIWVVKGAGGQSITEDYNGFYNTGEIQDQSNIVTSGGHRYTANPGMKTGDENLDNNMESFPASCYLDVNGGTDVGAYSSSRRATEGDGKVHIKVNDNGIINYSSVDFQSLSQAAEALCDNMVIDVATGSYAGTTIALSSLDGIEITGTSGSSSTTIDATGLTYGFSLDNVTNSEISGFNILGDSNTTAAIYLSNESDGNILSDLILKGISEVTTTRTKTRHPYTYNGTDYTAGLMMIYKKTGDTSDFYGIESDDEVMSTEVITGSPSGTVQRDWNLALAEGGGNYYSLYFNATDYPLESDALTELNALEMGTWTIDCWFENSYVWAGNSYAYTAPTGCAAGDPTLAAGYQTVPANPEISVKSSGALYIENSDNNQISSSRIGSGELPNGYGVSFVGSSVSNTIGSSMTWETNSSADIFTSSTGDNTITDCTALEYILAGTGALINCQTAPSGTLSSPTQDSGENTVSFTFTASDPDHETLKAKVEYEQAPGGACTGPWLKANLDTTVSATSGTPTVDNSAGYQITNISSSSTNTVSATWIANEIEGVNEDHCLQITVNDETADQTTPSHEAFYYSYQEPTPPVETGGTSIGAFLSGLASSVAADTPDEPTVDEPVAEEPEEEAVEEEPAPPAQDDPDLPNDTVIEYVYEYFAPEDSEEAPAEEEPEDEPTDEPTGVTQEELESAIEEYLGADPTQAPAQETYEGISEVSRGEISEAITGSVGLFYEEGEPITMGGTTYENLEAFEVALEEQLEEEGVYAGAFDFNENGIADVMEVLAGVDITNPYSDNDGDGVDATTEVICGTSLSDADGLGFLNPAIPDGVTMGSNSGFIICSDTPGKFEIALMSLELYEEMKESEEEIELEENWIPLGVGEIIGQTAVFTPREDVEIPEDEYYLLIIAEELISEVMTVTIADSLVPDAISLELSEEEVGQTLGFIRGFLGSEAHIDQWKDMIGATLTIGTDSPGIVYLTYNSLVVHSTVISDASEPLKINVNIPKILAYNEDHKLTAYIYNPELKTISNISSLIFRK